MSSSKRWLVLLSGCLIQAMLNGVIFAFGRLLINIMDTFLATHAEASLVQSMCVGVGRGGGIVWGMATSRLGPRNAGLIAALVSSAGLLASCFARTLTHLVISVGLFTTAGAATQTMCTAVAVGQHFSSKTNTIALSVLSTASAMGSIMHSYLLGYLSDKYGLRGTFLILAGFSLHGVAFAFLWDSPEFFKRKQVTDNRDVATEVDGSPKSTEKHFEYRSVENESITTMGSNTVQNEKATNGYENTAHTLTETNKDVVTKTTTIPKSDITSKKKHNHSGTNVKEKRHHHNFVQKFKVVLRNRHFVIFCLGTAIGYPCVQTMVVFLFDILVNKGFSESEASLVFILFHAFGVIGRSSSGIIMKIPKITTFSLPLIGSLLSMTTLWSLDFVQSFPLIIVLSCAGGISYGMFVSNATVCTVELVGVNYLPEALGLLFTTFGMSSVFAGPVAGSLRDITGTYTASLLVAASAASVAFMTFLFGQCYKKPISVTPKKIRMSVSYDM